MINKITISHTVNKSRIRQKKKLRNSQAILVVFRDRNINMTVLRLNVNMIITKSNATIRPNQTSILIYDSHKRQGMAYQTNRNRTRKIPLSILRHINKYASTYVLYIHYRKGHFVQFQSATYRYAHIPWFRTFVLWFMNLFLVLATRHPP